MLAEARAETAYGKGSISGRIETKAPFALDMKAAVEGVAAERKCSTEPEAAEETEPDHERALGIRRGIRHGGGRDHARNWDRVAERLLDEFCIYAVDLRAPLTLVDSRIAYNRAQLDEAPSIDIGSTRLEDWDRAQGLGGGAYVRNGRLRLVGSEFVENGASVAGGGAALVGCKAIFEENDSNRCRFARNKARVGGGLVLVGAPTAEATIKATNIVVERNKAIVSGGGFAVIGCSIVQCVRGTFSENEIADGLGHGGAVACHVGAELLAAGVEFVDNKTSGYGGALAAIDARLVIKDGARIRGNMARVSGGGVYCVTTNDPVAAELVRAKTIKLPLSVTLENTKISNNASSELGGGLRAGNEIGRPTLPLGIRIAEDVVFQLNRTKSQLEHGDDVWVVWAGQVKATDRDRPPKIVLR